MPYALLIEDPLYMSVSGLGEFGKTSATYRPSVTKLQTALKNKGYSISVDGGYGNETNKVFRKFIVANGGSGSLFDQTGPTYAGFAAQYTTLGIGPQDATNVHIACNEWGGGGTSGTSPGGGGTSPGGGTTPSIEELMRRGAPQDKPFLEKYWWAIGIVAAGAVAGVWYYTRDEGESTSTEGLGHSGRTTYRWTPKKRGYGHYRASTGRFHFHRR